MYKSLLPIIIEKDEDGIYTVECPIFSGCYTQGKTMDDAMKNITREIDNQTRSTDRQKHRDSERKHG